MRRRKSARQGLKPTWSKTNTKHMGASNLANMATERLQPFVPTTCPRWVSISILSNQSFCLNSLYQKAKHIAGFTRAPVKAFDRSRLTIQLGQFALNSQVKLAGPKAAANRFREQQVGENSPVPELSQCDSIFATSKSVPAGVGEAQFPSPKLACKAFPTSCPKFVVGVHGKDISIAPGPVIHM